MARRKSSSWWKLRARVLIGFTGFLLADDMGGG
jgi:hypothetical protein